MKQNWKHLFDEASKDELTSFLQGVLTQDERWRKEFCARFASRTPDQIASEVIGLIDDYFRRNEYDEYEWLDWRTLEEIGRHIQVIVLDTARPLLDKGDWNGAFTAGLAGLTAVRNHKAEDECYTLSGAACNAAFEVWKKIRERGGFRGKAIVADGCTAFVEETLAEESEDEFLDRATAARLDQARLVQEFIDEL